MAGFENRTPDAGVVKYDWFEEFRVDWPFLFFDSREKKAPLEKSLLNWSAGHLYGGSLRQV